MLYPIYTPIKQQLLATDTENTIKGIEWFAMQYEASITNTPRIFIEFTEKLNFEQLTKSAIRTPVILRMHVVSQAILSTDGVLDDSIPEEHEETAHLALKAIEGFRIGNVEIGGVNYRITTFHLSGWQHWPKYKGWMITHVELTALLSR